MTEDLDPTPRHGHSREPSSASLDIARLKERHTALKDNVEDMGATIMDIKALLLSHITSAGERHSQLLATFNQHNIEDTIVHQRVINMRSELDHLQEQAVKRDPVTLWTSIGAAATAAGAILAAIFGGKAP